ncbi:MAG: RnfABCDGE type electron transport complex subunit D [Oscillospiraceae bacterium]|jgi:electron transport complex protein RnfD|nr:RnfABCDGE type electron transport complex subunit D [Oscillospiraceae bacterium]
MDPLLLVSSSPHIRSDENTRAIMSDVIVALCFPLVISVYYFGVKALYLTLLSVACCVAFEFLYRKMLRKPGTVGDFSAVITGMLLAYTLPVAVPYWSVAAGAFFAIVIVKQLYGGLGKNFMNPALAGRAFLSLSFGLGIFQWTKPTFLDSDFSFVNMPDAVASPTPLGFLKQGVLPEGMELQDLLFGEIAGCLGETSAIALLLGGLYLVVRKVITPRIPLCFIGTVAVLSFLFPPGGFTGVEYMLYNILSGGLMLGAIFMATDYTTSPVTNLGQVFFAVGCGLLTVLIRRFGGMPEGVCFAILLMNTAVWFLDKIGRPRRFGAKSLWPFGGEAKK